MAARAAVARVVAVALAWVLAIGSAPDAGAAVPGPTPWGWWEGAAHQVTHGFADPPGMNDDSCRPSPEHPEPVVLVHGTGLNGGNSWASYAAELSARGFCVWAPTVGAPPSVPFAGGLASLTGTSAPQLAAEIDRVRGLTGAGRVDLVGHSQGAILAAYVAKVDRPDAVRTVVTLGVDPGRFGSGPPPQAQELLGVLSAETAAADVAATAAWLGPENLPYARGVRYAAILSDADELTGPVRGVSGPPGIDLAVIRLQDGCEQDRSGHLTVLSDPRAVDLTAAVLGDPRADGPRCVTADGIRGPVGAIPPR